MMQYNTIAELQNYIVLDNYVKSSIACEPPAGYQTEAALERELIDDLKNQGYEYVPEITSPDACLLYTSDAADERSVNQRKEATANPESGCLYRCGMDTIRG